jgi:hypothetical protein
MRDLSPRARTWLFAALAAACVAVTGGLLAGLVASSPGRDGGAGGAAGALEHARADRRPVVLARSLAAGEEGRLVLAGAVGDGVLAAGGPRCDRVHFNGARGICLARGGGFATGYRARLLDRDLRVTGEVALEGLASRARVSPDGRWAAVTMFVTGHAYADDGTFSTQTTIIDAARAEPEAELEEFSVTHRGRVISAVDVNFWGVTFAADGDRFYATLATGGRTFLVRGSIRDRTMRTLHANVECPSLSPDGTRIAYKRRTGSGDLPWRLTVLDLESLRETPLAESRGLDDQPEWLDDGHVLYGRGGDTWVVPADGSGAPRRLLAGADSPAAVRWGAGAEA